MSTTLILMLALAGDPATPPEQSPSESHAAGVSVRSERPLDRDALRAWYVELARQTTKRSRLEADEAVPQLVALHALVGDAGGLSSVERHRMRTTLESRLAWYEHRLRKQVAESQRSRLVPSESPSGSGPPSLAGTRSLIDLIQRTVNPPIWDVNGGPASIGYLPTYHALVVRAPGEVHHQIGGTLGQLRRAGR